MGALMAERVINVLCADWVICTGSRKQWKGPVVLLRLGGQIMGKQGLRPEIPWKAWWKRAGAGEPLFSLQGP